MGGVDLRTGRWWCRLPAALLLAVWASVTLGIAPVSAAGPLEVVSVGWDGSATPGTWTPLRVRVTGGRADATARVEVVLYQRAQPSVVNGPPVAAYGQEVALPSGVTKDVTIWAPVEMNMVGAVRLTAGGRVLADEPVEFKSGRAPGWPLVGVLAESPAVARSAALIELPLQQGLRAPVGVANLATADLPAIGERLGGLRALVVQGSAATALTGEQRRAIQEWVTQGGHLVVSGGPDAPRAAAILPQGALPLTFAGSDVAADLTPLSRLAGDAAILPSPGAGPVALFQAGAGAVLAGTPDHPLVWRTTMGRGSVTVLAADLGLEPLTSWVGEPALLRAALGPALPGPLEDDRSFALRAASAADAATRLQGAVDALPPDAFPDWRSVALILGGFALVIGPVVHVLLRWLDRREWVWLVVPAGALLTCAGLYVAGVGQGGRDVLVNVVSYVQLQPELGQARQALAAGFFAPTHPRLVATVPEDTPVRVRAGFDVMGALARAGSQAPATEPPVRVVAGRDTQVEFTAGEGSVRAVMLTRTLGKDVGRIASALTIEGGVLKGTVRNETPFALEDAGVVVGANVARLGRLAPGQTAQVTLDLGPVTSRGAAAGQYLGNVPMSLRLLGQPSASGAVRSRGGVFGVAVSSSGTTSTLPAYAGAAITPDRYQIPRDPEAQRRARLLDAAVVEPPRLGPGPSAGLPPTLFAFTRSPIGTGLPSAGKHPTYQLTLVQQSLRLEPPAGPFTVPAAVTPPEIVGQASRGLGFGSNNVGAWLELQGGAVTYAFRPPLPARFSADALVIATRQVGSSAPVAQGRGTAVPPNATPGAAEPGTFAIYNWQSASWELLGSQEQARAQPATPYLGPDGTVKVQVSAAADRLVRFAPPEVAVEGTVA